MPLLSYRLCLNITAKLGRCPQQHVPGQHHIRGAPARGKRAKVGLSRTVPGSSNAFPTPGEGWASLAELGLTQGIEWAGGPWLQGIGILRVRCWVWHWGVCSEVRWERWEAGTGPEGKTGGDLEKESILYPQTNCWLLGLHTSTGCRDLGRRARLAN